MAFHVVGMLRITEPLARGWILPFHKGFVSKDYGATFSAVKLNLPAGS